MALNLLEYQELLRNLPDPNVVGRAKKGDDRSWMAGDELKRREEMRSAEAAEMAEKQRGEPNVMEQYISRAQGMGQAPQMGQNPMDPSALAGMGRGGDTNLMHVGPEQVNQMGTSINPQTGLPEALPPLLPLLAGGATTAGLAVLRKLAARGIPWAVKALGQAAKNAPVKGAGAKLPSLAGAAQAQGRALGGGATAGTASKSLGWLAKHPWLTGMGVGGGAGIIQSLLSPTEPTEEEERDEKIKAVQALAGDIAGSEEGKEVLGAKGDEGSPTSGFDRRMQEFRDRYAALDEDIEATGPPPSAVIWDQLAKFGEGLMTPGDFGVAFRKGMSAAAGVPAEIRAEERATQGERVDLVAAESQLEVAIQELAIMWIANQVKAGKSKHDIKYLDFAKLVAEHGIGGDLQRHDPHAFWGIVNSQFELATGLLSEVGQRRLPGRMAMPPDKDGILWGSGSTDDE